MDIKEFEKTILGYLKELNIDLSSKQIKQFYDYMNLLIEWNKVMNLTGITEPTEIIIKHFVDSLTVLEKIDKKSAIIDVGTGAGLPGVPIKIAYPETKIVLLDSLNKRINFLDEVIKKLELKDITAIHGRAEDLGRDRKHREKYDIAIARAVAPLNILLEYLMPLIKTTGICLCMKGSKPDEELEKSGKAIKSLKGDLLEAKEFYIPNTDIKRTIISIQKTEKTPDMYPRKAGMPNKKPL